MPRRTLASLVVVLFSLAPTPSSSQTSSSGTQATKRWTPPRSPDGHPDLQGIWLNNDATPLERPKALEGKQFLTDEEVATLRKNAARLFGGDVDSDAAGGDGYFLAALANPDVYKNRNATGSGVGANREIDNRTSLIVDPPDGKIPLMTPAGRRRRLAESVAAFGAPRPSPPEGPEDFSNFIRCLTYGAPRLGGAAASYHNYYQIVQTPGYVMFLSEAMHDARIIPLDGRQHLPQNIRGWLGDSRGRWEGNTLIVETTNYSPKSSFLGSAENLHVVERFTRTAFDRITYEITLTDPTTWATPWTAVVRLKRTDDKMYEDACHEGNENVMMDILAAARADEKASVAFLPPQRAARQTVVSIQGREFLVNGLRTYAGRSYEGTTVQGLLFNSRMVQGVFDDRNPETRPRWNYPDGPWDAERNTREFIAAMPLWKAKGLLAFTINLQGGSPEGYSRSQPWVNSSFEADGTLRQDYMSRLGRILDRADELGMVTIVGLFYQAQERRMNDGPSSVRAADAATDWLIDKGYTNVLVEVANEADNSGFTHDIIKPAARGVELIERLKERSKGKVASPAGRLLVSTSLNGGAVPSDSLVNAVDFVLLHGNGVRDPSRITQMVDDTRALPRYRGQPVVFNEDDHFDFDKPRNNMLAALRAYAGWGFFDYRMAGERFDDGYQSVPVNWTISSPRKRGFFDLLAQVTGGSQ